MAQRNDTRTDDRLQTAAKLVGLTFLAVGVLGFVPGVTSNYSDMSFAGNESDAKLLGIFEVSVLHNIVHLLFGVLGIVAAKAWSWAKTYLIVGGLTYLALWLYGMVIDKTSDANFVPVNSADDWLHFVLGTGMVALGVLLSRDAAPAHRGTASNRR